MSREGHAEAVGAAIASIAEIQELIAVGTDRCESAMGAVIMAVGQNPNVDSAQAAMNFTAEIKNRFDETYRITEAAIEQLNSYLAGF